VEPNLSDIALFVEVVNTRSFSRAAERLDLPASTLSRRIAKLETAIGSRLLNRTTRRVELTEMGSAYYARCSPLVEEARQAHADLAVLQDRVSGVLRLSCTPEFASLYLPEPLLAFTRRHADVGVELDLSARYADLFSEQLDAAIRLGPTTEASLVTRRLGQLGRALYASPDYLAGKPRPQEPQDLADHLLVGLRRSLAQPQWHLQRREAEVSSSSLSVPVQARFVAGSMGMQRELVLRGAGIAALDELLVAPDVAAGRLLPVLPAWRLRPVPVYLVTVSRLMPARLRQFLPLLEAQLRGEPLPI
jgi:DNA-binding transcriptional LysR family regulator